MKLDEQHIIHCCNTWGSPLYIFDEDSFVHNYQHFENCFKNIYKNYRISYSYKTNYAPYICKLVHNMGGFAEVVSDMELSFSRRVGNPDEMTVYNGPCKGPLLEGFILNGGIVNIDHFDELNRILSFAQKHPDHKIRFGIRVNISIGQNFVSRFGIDESDLDKAFEITKRAENASIVGLHCHIGRSRSLDAWKKRTDKMLALSDLFFPDPPEYISLGSGMFGEMDPQLSCQFGDYLPSFEEYAEVVARPFEEHFSGIKQPILFTEPGTTLINKYISFVTKVVAVKHIKGRVFIVLDGSKHNIGELCELKRIPIQILGSSDRREAVLNADFVGYTCLEHDVLYKSYCGKIAAGDYVVFDNVGGYSIVSKPPFILPNCCVISSNGSLIKRKESAEEVICTYE